MGVTLLLKLWKNSAVPAAGNVDFTLVSVGDYLYSNGAIVAHTVGKLHSCFAGMYTRVLL